MIPILTAEQVRAADAFTIANEPISSIDLMERASQAFVRRFTQLVGNDHKIKIFCGTGNNGGDGLAIARILKEKNYTVSIYTTGYLGKTTEDFKTNFDRLLSIDYPHHIDDKLHFPHLSEEDVIIDGLFGSGLSRPVEGFYADLIEHINHLGSKIISIDIASGLFADNAPLGSAVIKPNFTIAFQLPKLVFFQPSLNQYVGDWYVEDIGLDQKFIQEQETNYSFSESKDFLGCIQPRTKFMHKGDAGRLLLVSGGRGKMGAAVLAAKAAMRTGTGLLTVHTPHCGLNILQVSVPEAMVSTDTDEQFISNINLGFTVDAIGIGPGISQDMKTVEALRILLSNWKKPLVLDADAINILSENRALIELIPESSILTPHPGEFKRLVGEWKNDLEKLELLQGFCRKYRFNVVLKGAYSVVCDVAGNVVFNPTGNPGMATAGSGDALTGIVSSFLSQGYAPNTALKLAVYVHGLAGDFAAKEFGENSMMASDIIENIPKAIKTLQSES